MLGDTRTAFPTQNKKPETHLNSFDGASKGLDLHHEQNFVDSHSHQAEFDDHHSHAIHGHETNAHHHHALDSEQGNHHHQGKELDNHEIQLHGRPKNHNEEVAIGYGQSLPVQPGYGHSSHQQSTRYGQPIYPPAYQPHPAPTQQYYLAPQPQAVYGPPIPQPIQQYQQYQQYQPLYSAPAPAPVLSYQQPQTYSYPSAALQAPCASNLLFSCSPQVQQVPCSYSPYDAYGQIPTVPSTSPYRSADTDSLAIAAISTTPAATTSNTTLDQSTKNGTSSNTTVTNSSTASTATNAPTQLNTDTKQPTVGAAAQEIQFNSEKIDNTQPSDENRKLDDAKKHEHHKPTVTLLPVHHPRPLPPQYPTYHMPSYPQPHHAHFPAYKAADPQLPTGTAMPGANAPNTAFNQGSYWQP